MTWEGLSDKSVIIEQQKIIIEQQKTIDLQAAQIEEFLNKIQALESRIKELENRLNINSNNSSKPPSSDGLKKKIANNRKPSDKKTGGQEGHEGTTLLKAENPDKIIDAPNTSMCDCGCNLEHIDEIIKTRQVHDIIPAKLHVTEYVSREKVCPNCGKMHKTEFPENVTQPVEYGDNLKTLVTYLNEYQLLPLDRTVETIEDMIGKKISQGTVVNINEKLFDILEEPVKSIKEQLIESDVVHFDETGIRNQGKTQWLHVSCTDELTYYESNAKRGKEAMEEIDILPKFQGTAIHDHLKSYYTYTKCGHGECNAHNLRYLIDIHENHEQNWAKVMYELLIEIKKQVEKLKTEGLKEMNLKEAMEWSEKYHKIIIEGLQEDYEKNKKLYDVKDQKKAKNSKARNLLLKIQKYDIETLAFMYDFDVPFDNNLAERDLRMQKLRQKISGCFRGKEGAKVFCRIRSYISTARKNGVKAFDAIKNAFTGNAFIPTSNPSNST
jgi:transposase